MTFNVLSKSFKSHQNFLIKRQLALDSFRFPEHGPFYSESSEIAKLSATPEHFISRVPLLISRGQKEKRKKINSSEILNAILLMF